MTIEFWALTLDLTGKIIIAAIALIVHQRIKKEHKIDKKVLKEMKVEQCFGAIGIILIIAGYILHLYGL